jgi:hypothetical protein
MKMKTTLLSFTIALLLFSAKGFGQSKPTPADKICGLYWSPRKDAKIEIYKEENFILESLSGWLSLARMEKIQMKHSETENFSG